MGAYDDSQGKFKAADARSRSAALSAVLIVGICIGIVISEKLYLRNEEYKLHYAGNYAARATKAIAASSRRSNLDRLDTDASFGSDFSAKADDGPGLFVKGRTPRNELEKVLQKVAPDGEVMIAISNMNLIRSESLRLWLDCALKIESKNWLVVAIDEELRDYLKERGINHYYRPVVIPKTQENTGDNHAVSAMKYEIIEEFLTLGWNVLLSDVDIVIVEDPLQHLYRDHDVEGMSDGFDDHTCYGEIYGVDDESMGWSRYAQGVRHMVMNSGLFWLRAGPKTIELMQRIASRLRKEHAWDQSVYNEEIFFLSHGSYKSPQVSVRVMERDKFMNSKTLFKFVRNLPEASQPRPVMVHMNYHPDKTERMRGAIKYYLEGDKNALKKFPGGSEPGS